jgi:hypothetical protein
MTLAFRFREAILPYRFGAWLASKQPRASVGTAGDPNDCPISRYVHELSEGALSATVYRTVVTIRDDEGNTVRELNAPWVRRFVALVDDFGFWTGDQKALSTPPVPIPARVASRFLNILMS